MKDIKAEILNIASKIENEIIEARQKLHENPELSGEEFKTADFICEYLSKIKVKYRKNIAGCGVMAEIFGEKSGAGKMLDNVSAKTEPKTVLFRADVDALPVCEAADVPYKSKIDGVMHACGHDVHTAAALGICNVLSELKQEFDGCVKVIFQPAEETTGGALPMICEGVLENPKVSAAVAYHCDPDLPCGTFRIKEGPFYASPDNFYITVKGRGGHGAQPDLCINPITAAAKIVSRLTETFENLTDDTVLSVCQINSGSAPNVIPDIAKISGTVRTMTPISRENAEKEIENIAVEICKDCGAEYEYEFEKLYPPLINNSDICSRFKTSAEKYGTVVWGGAHTMAGEDFSYISERVPSALIRLGTGISAPLHSAEFKADSNALKYGIAAASDFIIEYLKN